MKNVFYAETKTIRMIINTIKKNYFILEWNQVIDLSTCQDSFIYVKLDETRAPIENN